MKKEVIKLQQTYLTLNKIEVYKHYNYDNKIPLAKAREVLEIIIPFYNELNGKDNSSKEMCDPWLKMIRNTKDYNIILLYFDDLLVGFVNYMYQDGYLMISEIQIKKEYQGKHNILRKLLREMLINSEKNRYSKILGTINKKNTKSIEVFAHIGFINIKDNLYQISYDELFNWINK